MLTVKVTFKDWSVVHVWDAAKCKVSEVMEAFNSIGVTCEILSYSPTVKG